MNFKKVVMSAALSASIIASLIPMNVMADESFYSSVSDMIQDNWSEDYVGSIELTIGDSNMLVDGEEKEIDPGRGTAPQIIDDRTMLPIRAIVEELGGEVGWNGDTREVEINVEDKNIRLQLDNKNVDVNGVSVASDIAPVSINDRTMVPVRVVAENLLCDVEWDGSTKTATITKTYQTKRIIVSGEVSESDYSRFNPTSVVTDGSMTVLQFSTMQDAKDCCEALSALPSVAYAEPDEYIPPVDTEEGTSASAASFNSWGVEYIKADKYAEYLKKAGKNKKVKVAVIDTGVAASHPFLAGKVVQGKDFVNNDNNAYDDHGHGTHVAGTIIDCTPGLDIEIIPIKVLNAKGSGTSLQVALGVKYAGEVGADIANLSLGGAAGSCSSKDKEVDKAIDKGVTFAFAAGNESTDVRNRCFAHLSTPGTVVVAAHDSNGKAASFSNFGGTVDIGAPGVAIKSSIPASGYAIWNGTSMATPHVAACLAMIKMANPDLEPEEIEAEFKKAANVAVKPYFTGKNYGSTIDMSKLIAPIKEEKEIVAYEWQVDGKKATEYKLPLNQKLQLTLAAVYADKTTKPVTTDAGLEILSTDGSIIDVAKDGLVTPKAKGLGRVIFTFAVADDIEIPKPFEVTVVDPVEEKKITAYKWQVDGKDATSVDLDLVDKKSAQVDLLAVYSDNSTKKVTTDAKLSVVNSKIANITADGKLTAAAIGSTQVIFGFAVGDDINNPAPLVVNVKGEKKMVRLEWSTKEVNLETGKTAEIILYAVYDDKSKEDMTERCQVYAIDEAVAKVAGKTITAVASGETTLWLKKIPQTGIEMPGVATVTVK